MQVVFSAVDAVQMAIHFFDDTKNVIVQFVAMAFGDSWLPVFCAEDNVIENLPVGAHEVLVCVEGNTGRVQVTLRNSVVVWWVVVVQPFQGCGKNLTILSPGCTRSYSKFKPFRLKERHISFIS